MEFRDKMTLPLFICLLAAGVSGPRPAHGGSIVRNGDKIAYLGDSITEHGHRKPLGYVNLVRNGLKSAGIKTSCVKAGVLGNDSSQMLTRLERDVLSQKPQLMTLSCGVNDVWHGFENPPRGVALPEYRRNVTEILDRCTAAGVKVVLLTATMIHEDDADPRNVALAPYNAWIREIARERRIPLADMNRRMHETLAARRAANPSKGNKLTWDGVHMSQAGDEMMAQCLLEAMGVWPAFAKEIRAGWRALDRQVRSGCRMNPVFSEGVVLQRDRPVRIWGTARPGENVRVSFGGQTRIATAAADGSWMVVLDPMSASKNGRDLVAKFMSSKVAQTVSDVLVGEVWICSGQSNMDCPIWGQSPRYRDAWGALAVCSTVKPHVRLAKTPKSMSAVPLHEVSVDWRMMTPSLMCLHESGKEMPSAVGYYFALEIANSFDVPVGIVDASWGGTHIDPWVPQVGYEGLEELAFERNWKTLPKSEFRKETMVTNMITAAEEQPSALWNAMVAPYAPMSVRGMLWYQGCQNVKEPHRYAAKMHALYNGWSKEFRNPDLRLYFVQLAPWGNPLVPLMQESQARFAAEEKIAAIAIINDTGNLHDVHPNDKRTVAKRLALHALRRDYGYSWLKDDSPAFKACRGDGNRVILSFEGAESWYVYNEAYSMTNGFEICGVDGKWRPAKILNLAKTRRTESKPQYEGALEGKDVVISADGVGTPKAVRYLHSRPWLGSLYNEMGLPLGAFHASVVSE